MASRSVEQLTAERPLLYNGPPLRLSKLPLFMGIWTPSNTWFLGPTGVFNPNASRSVQPFLQGSLLWHTDRQTDQLIDGRPHYSVGNSK